MSPRELRYINYICTMLVTLICLITLAASSGCTRYRVVKGTAECPDCTEVSVWSNREFEQPNLTYNRSQTSDGGSVGFTFGAESATQAVTPLEAVGAAVIQNLMNTYLPGAATEPPSPAPTLQSPAPGRTSNPPTTPEGDEQ